MTQVCVWLLLSVLVINERFTEICLCAADTSFQSLVIFFFLKPSQSDALLSAVRQLTSHITAMTDDDDAAGSESVFDMECQNISTHVAGSLSVPLTTDDTGSRQAANDCPSPVFGRRGIHDVKPSPSLQALHAYDDQDDEPEDPLPSTAATIEEIVVPVGFSSPIIKYVNFMLTFGYFCLLIGDGSIPRDCNWSSKLCWHWNLHSEAAFSLLVVAFNIDRLWHKCYVMFECS